MWPTNGPTVAGHVSAKVERFARAASLSCCHLTQRELGTWSGWWVTLLNLGSVTTRNPAAHALVGVRHSSARLLAVPVSNLSTQLLFSRSVVSNSLRPHGLQHARLPCPSSPKGCSNSCLLSWWCYPISSSSAALFSFCLESFPTSGSFPMSCLSASGGQSIGVTASVLPMSIQGWFLWGWTGLICLLSKGLSGVFSSTTIWKYHFFSAQPSLRSYFFNVCSSSKNFASPLKSG